ASAGPTETEFAGLVPDRVARVLFTPAGGTPIGVPVSSNFYDLDVPGSSAAPKPVTPPPGYTGPTITPAPRPAAGRVEWLDGAGRVIRPEAG
ncbi:MAG TPA: hypothetical protein VHW26_02680, partial [Solirubrobacteraceae bacterium]|nr:hypothetical protein [Solirubrobacteraceae bacterium]